MALNISSKIIQHLKNAGVDFFLSVPCKLLADMIEQLEVDSEVTYLPVTREEEGVGLCAGAYLGGRMPCILMQDSVLGNSANALASLIQFYRIPMILLISYRGTPGEAIGAQVPMAHATKGLLDTLKIPTLHCHAPEHERDIKEFAEYASVAESAVAILVDFQFMEAN